MMKTVAVDVDDTIAELVVACLARYAIESGEYLNETDIKTWHIHDFVKIRRGIYDYLLDPKIYDTVLPVPGANRGVIELKEMGYRVIFVTSASHGQEGRKFKWLIDNHFLKPDNKNDYIEAKDKTLIATNYLIDDNPTNVTGAYGTGIVYHREWNKSLPSRYFRAYDWDDVVKYFSERS